MSCADFDVIYFKTIVTKTANNYKYKIVKSPTFRGNIAHMEKSYFNLYRGVTLQLNKIDADEYSQLDVTFQNACFNCLGFLVHVCI